MKEEINMTEKEIAEIRRRFNIDKTNISNIDVYKRQIYSKAS